MSDYPTVSCLAAHHTPETSTTCDSLPKPVLPTCLYFLGGVTPNCDTHTRLCLNETNQPRPMRATRPTGSLRRREKAFSARSSVKPTTTDQEATQSKQARRAQKCCRHKTTTRDLDLTTLSQPATDGHGAHHSITPRREKTVNTILRSTRARAQANKPRGKRVQEKSRKNHAALGARLASSTGKAKQEPPPSLFPLYITF